MRSSRRKLNKRSEGVDFDKRFEQVFEAGRQIADGFSGARPGARKRSSFRDFSRRNVRKVGNWVTEQMDSLFEDDYEESTNYDFNTDENEFKSFRRSIDSEEVFSSPGRRPLEAISLRSKDNIEEQQKKLAPSNDNSNQDWEEDSFYQINKWKRSSKEKDDYPLDQKSDNKRISSVRNFPRSRRSRL
tara:strand:+ start:771 stop:1331 length:561 start_codon:yes stop_codon:yes gene_type:complete